MNLTQDQKDALNIEKHVCVTAGAGSGKTAVLVERYLNILRNGKVSPEKIVAITFTEKAASEMKGRIVEKLNDKENTDLREIHLEQMNTAPISTIHAFCSRILREFPFQAGVPANFTVLQGIEQTLFLQESINRILRDIATNRNHNLYAALSHSLMHFGNQQNLIDLFTTMVHQRDLISSLVENIYDKSDTTHIPKVWHAILSMDEDETIHKELIDTTHHLLSLYTIIIDNYQNDKLSQSRLDFNDLQIKTHELLNNQKQITHRLIERYQYYMVDEFQDTNELQYKLVMQLTNSLKDANLFIVGDPKQSIYSFRGADVRVFNRIRDKIIDADGLNISLNTNFRSLPHILEFVNYLFDKLMVNNSESQYEVSYEPLTQGRFCHDYGTVEIVIGQRKNEEANEYAIIAQRINRMIINKEMIWARREGKDRPPQPIQYSDIAILIRARRQLPDLEHALLSNGIPYLTTGGVGFYQRQEIYDIWNYLNFLNNPSKNDTSLVGILRGPAYGISDIELYEISLSKGNGFWEKAQNYHFSTNQLTEIIDTIKNHINIAHRYPLNQLIQTVVNETGLIGTINIGIKGQQSWANYQKLLDLAREYDADENQQTLTAFIEFLNNMINNEPNEGQAPIEESTGAVQIMTIHSAKGKQFPVVILPGLDRGGKNATEPFVDEKFGIGFSPYNPNEGYLKTIPDIVEPMKEGKKLRDEAEKKRLFYVGATRAEDRLILSASLNHYSKPDNILKWLYEYLNIGDAGDRLKLKPNLEVSPKNDTSTQSREINIPIIKTLDNIETFEKISSDNRDITFPESPVNSIESLGFKGSYSVLELANYMRCPLRYQLENVLRITNRENNETDLNTTEMASAIGYVIDRVKSNSQIGSIDSLIERTLKYLSGEGRESKTTEFEVSLRKHVNNFLSSELKNTILSASETYTNHRLFAEIHGHLITGTLDRLIKDSSGQWQIIYYQAYDTHDLEYYRPEIELYALLMHKVYPNETSVIINYYSTETNMIEQKNYNQFDLQKITDSLLENISSLQQEQYIKNLNHCSSCIYANSLNKCIISEP